MLNGGLCGLVDWCGRYRFCLAADEMVVIRNRRVVSSVVALIGRAIGVGVGPVRLPPEGVWVCKVCVV